MTVSPDFKFKKSKASVIWAFVVISVLIVLFLETSTTRQAGYNVVVLTGKNMVGMDVYVDNKQYPKIQKAENLGSKEGITWLALNDGEHTIEIKDASQKPLTAKQFTVKGKALINLKQ